MDVKDRFDVIPDLIFQIVECQTCKLLFLNPRPDVESIGMFYETDQYDPFGSDSESQSLSTRLYQFARPFSIRRKASRVVKGLRPGTKTLDVGCATGEFMVELRRRGFQPYGVEPNPKAAAYATEKLGLNVLNGGIENASVDSGPYSLISFWHVLEHVHRLQENLSTARDLLTADGRLAIAVPNPDSWDAHAYGTDWVAWDAPRHLYHFTPDVMMNLLTRMGFRPVHTGAVAFDAFYHCILSERPGAIGLIRGGLRGSMSFCRGILGKYGSSELYIAYKN
jgi:SAM-dependent methyltransferase